MSGNFTQFARAAAMLAVAVATHLPALAQTSRVDPSFPPVQATSVQNGVSVPASINDVVRQADGKYIIGGNFTSINGVAALRLARLESDGRVDAAFTAACQADGAVYSLALQPDGRVVVGGSFRTLAGATRTYIGRLETSGAIDASFAPYVPAARTTGGINKLQLQSNGQVLVCGLFNLRGPSYTDQYVARINSNGQYDASFQFALPTPDTAPATIVLQPNGQVLVGGYGPSYRRAFMLMRLQSDGTVDTNFNVLESTFTSELNTLELDAAGRIYAAGMFQNGPGNPLLRRYLPNGTIDPAYTYSRTFATQYPGAIKTIALQPNGRLLVAHGLGAERVLADGTFDTSFIAGIGGLIQRFLVQPDGAIMVAGAAISGTGATGAVGLVRILDSNVLRVQASVAEPRTAVWPVPAQDVLHLTLDAASRPQRVQLLDAVGRAVLTVENPAVTLQLPLNKLTTGMYQVRVEYANGARVMRRVAVNH